MRIDAHLDSLIYIFARIALGDSHLSAQAEQAARTGDQKQIILLNGLIRVYQVAVKARASLENSYIGRDLRPISAMFAIGSKRVGA